MAPHPLQDAAREFFRAAMRNHTPLCTSAEVIQELAHAYLRVGRKAIFDAAVALLAEFNIQVWPLEREDVMLARQLHERYPHLSARDLCHLATCLRRGVSEMMTFDQYLTTAFNDAFQP